MSIINVSTLTQQPNLVSVTGPTTLVLSIDVPTEIPNVVITAETSGPQGPMGLTGPVGPQGETGPQGSPLLRSTSIVSNANITPDLDTTDLYTVTALAVNATIDAPSGTPVNGQRLILRIKDNGTARALAFNAIYRAIGITLPSTTVNNKTIYLGMFYNSTDIKWDVVAYVVEA